MNKILTWMTFLGAALAIASSPVCASDSGTESGAVSTPAESEGAVSIPAESEGAVSIPAEPEGAVSTPAEPGDVSTPADAASDGKAGLSGDPLKGLKWSDYAISVDGDVLKFPMLYSDFAACGYEAEDDLSTTLQPMQYSWFYFTKDGHRVSFTVANFANNTLPADECVVCGMTIDSYYWPVDEGEILLPEGIVRGEATIGDVAAAYGDPSDVYEGELYTSVTYETDIYEEMDLKFNAESGVLTDIDMRKIVRPEGFDAGEISEEIPARVSSYRKPEELSGTLGSFELKIKDDVYSFPVPVRTLIEDGWEINPANSDEFIPGKSTAWVTLQRGGKNFRTMASNYEDNAVKIENGWITSLEVGLQNLNVDAELAGGVTIGMDGDEFRKLLEASGLPYELDDESRNFHYYTFAKDDWNNYIQVIVYVNGDTYPENTVLTIGISRTDLMDDEGAAGEAGEAAVEEGIAEEAAA